MADDLHPGQRSSAVILGGRSRGGDAQFLKRRRPGRAVEEGARLNRVADHVDGALLAFRALGHGQFSLLFKFHQADDTPSAFPGPHLLHSW
jgi:hypothetical protein